MYRQFRIIFSGILLSKLNACTSNVLTQKDHQPINFHNNMDHYADRPDLKWAKLLHFVVGLRAIPDWEPSFTQKKNLLSFNSSI